MQWISSFLSLAKDIHGILYFYLRLIASFSCLLRKALFYCYLAMMERRGEKTTGAKKTKNVRYRQLDDTLLPSIAKAKPPPSVD